MTELESMQEQVQRLVDRNRKLQGMILQMRKIVDDQYFCCSCFGKGTVTGQDGASDEICDNCGGSTLCPIETAVQELENK